MSRHEFFPPPPSSCPYCGADRTSAYKHSDTCLAQLVELEGPYDQLIRAWRDGTHSMLYTGTSGKTHLNPRDPRDEAHEMGAACALAAMEKGQKAAENFAIALSDPKYRLDSAVRA